jgi:hypothetical protein
LRFARWMAVALGLGATVAGCTSDLKLALEGKQCNADQRCVDGYECDVLANLCVPLEQVPHADGGLGGSVGNGFGGDPGNGGLVSAGPGGSGLGGAGLRGASGGPGGNSGAAGAGGAANDPDGGSNDLPDADGGCVPTTVYHDVDGDTFGSDSDATFACPSVEWVTVGGDCRDDLPLVKPGQTQHFAVGYPASSPGGVSFNYDCANGETPDPDNDTNDEVPDCSTLLGLGLGCVGSGFEPASPARSGVGVEPRCGSKVRTDCSLNGTCTPRQSTLADSEAFRCR